MRSLTLVFSPFQMLNAIEARHSLQEPEDECHLVYCRGVSDANARQIESMIDPDEWSSVHFLEDKESPLTLRRRAHRLAEIWREYSPVDRLIVGHFGFSLARNLARTFRPAETVVLDDGTASHRNYESRFEEVQGGEGRKVAFYKRLPLVRWAKRAILGIDARPYPAVTHFSIYRHRIHACDRYLPNTFRHWRAKRKATSTSEEIYFLGGCLVELGIVSAATYNNLLATAARAYRGRPVSYLPHRREDHARVRAVAAQTGWSVLNPGVPVEMHLLQRDILPGLLASAYSTALDSCYTLFSDLGMNFEAFVLRPQDFLRPGQADFVDLVYDYYRRTYGTGFRLVECGPI
jgi:hypothetical protein